MAFDLPPSAFGRWRITPESVAERRAALDAMRPRSRQLCFDFEAPRCQLCDDDGEVDCQFCEGAGCRRCDDTGRQDCACEGGPDDDGEEVDDEEVPTQ